MTISAAQWNPKQSRLKEIINNPGRFIEAVSLCLEMHALLHASDVSGSKTQTFEDKLWDGLTESMFRALPAGHALTIAWNIWHITRIEDITVNILIEGDSQVINSGDWNKRLNTSVRDTGNAMTRDEILDFSAKINWTELRNYRMAVGRQTRHIIGGLKYEDMKKKPAPDRLKRILDEGGVLEDKDSVWLIDFWGRKTTAGILLMPAARHQVVHLNDAFKIKEKCLKTV